MPEPIITLVPITQLALPPVDPTPKVDMLPIQDVPVGRPLPQLPTLLPATPKPVSYGPEPSATVQIVDKAPDIPFVPVPRPVALPWWKDPVKLGLAAAALLLLLALRER